MDCPALGEDVSLNVHAYDGVPRMNVPQCVEGAPLTNRDTRGIWVQKEFAQANGLSVGDDLRLDVLGQEQTFVIRGLIYDAEHVITAKDVTPEPAKYGYAVICWNAVPQLPLNEAVVRLEAGADRDQVEHALQDLLPQALILTQQTHASTQRTRADVDIFQNLTLVFPILAYLVASMVVLTTLTRMIENQRTQMGTLKALGYRDGQIRRHYLCYAPGALQRGRAAGHPGGTLYPAGYAVCHGNRALLSAGEAARAGLAPRMGHDAAHGAAEHGHLHARV